VAVGSFVRRHPGWFVVWVVLAASLILGLSFAFLGSGSGGSNLTPLEAGAVPFVVGLDEPLAVQKLASRGFKVEVRRVHVVAPKGTVTAQGPAAGSMVSRGSLLWISVSAGK
jgi:beta-lactam-binding protein with PASTA domain